MQKKTKIIVLASVKTAIVVAGLAAALSGNKLAADSVITYDEYLRLHQKKPQSCDGSRIPCDTRGGAITGQALGQ